MICCHTCAHYQNFDDEDLCRRMPPTVFRTTYEDRHGHTEVEYISRWPIVSRTSWCGEWKARASDEPHEDYGDCPHPERA